MYGCEVTQEALLGMYAHIHMYIYIYTITKPRMDVKSQKRLCWARP